MGPRYPKNILECPNARARIIILESDDPIAGQIKVLGNPLKLSMVAESPSEPLPTLGQHTEEILSITLKMTPARVAGLRAQSIV